MRRDFVTVPADISVAEFQERVPLGTASNPTPLSISWVLKDYVDLLADAAGRSAGKTE